MRVVFLFILFLSFEAFSETPTTFRASKSMMKKVYQDNTSESFYCGCSWQWSGRKGSGRMDLSSCGYAVRSNDTRAKRLEWEHVVPISVYGKQLACWSEAKTKMCGSKRCDSRNYCRSTSREFALAEADMVNLVPSVGEVNGTRSNYIFGVIHGEAREFGQCDFEFDSRSRIAEPRESKRGMIARTYFYMADQYNIRLQDSQVRLFKEWNQKYPPTPWEVERNRRIQSIQGRGNHFVAMNHSESIPYTGKEYVARPAVSDDAIRGNRRSKIYHLPVGCPSYGKVSSKNTVIFSSEGDAKNAGYRKAGNCN